MPNLVVLTRWRCCCLLCRHKPRRRIPASDLSDLTHGETPEERLSREQFRIRVR